METNEVNITLRVNRNLKDSAEALFSSLGMNMTTAVNVFLTQSVHDQSIPFMITAKQTQPLNTLPVAEITQAFTETIQKDKAESIARGLPISGYDRERAQAYLQYPDGKKEYINE